MNQQWLIILKNFVSIHCKEKSELKLDDTHPVLVIFDSFKAQTTDQVLKLLEDNHIYSIMVLPNCTDRLQPMDISVNKAAKHFLREQFQTWYSNEVLNQFTKKLMTPVDLNILSVMKPLGAQWMIKLHDYLVGKPEIIQNGFKGAGISDCLEV